MRFLLFLFISSWFFSCSEKKLPVIGFREVIDGKTVYAVIPDFTYDNQHGTQLSRSDLKGKIHIANFFFTSCPTICPKTMRSMVRIANHFGPDPSIQYICYSIDFRKDSVPRLKEYYEKLGIDFPNFHLLRMPDKDELKRVPQKYLSIAMEDSTAAGGFDHSGWLLLVDKDLHIRSYCLGTDDKEVDRFIKDIGILMHE
ncbi:MAG: SCO family protein [Saprospiraceae bacterium]|nr:SCO family protein [Saprospiraceae bacterium]